MIGIVNKVVAEINSSAQYITHISGKLRNGTVSSSCSKEPHEYGDDIPLHPFISEDLLLT
jgi:hypothetical protein